MGFLAPLLVHSSLYATPILAQWPMSGWSAYRDFDLAAFREGETERQFSSYDRTNANDDGFEGTYSCLRIESGRCVVAEADGPGQISSMWFTYAYDSVIGVGNIQIELDGTTVVDDILQSVVDGQLGSPFIWPFVGNLDDTSGGAVIKVPMTYSKSMRVTTQNNPHFYHIMYREFPPGTQVSTFDPKEDVADIISSFQRFGVRDPKTVRANANLGNQNLSIPVGSSRTIPLGDACGTITQFQIRVPEIPASAEAEDDGRAFGAGGGSSMILLLDENNSECMLTRRIDKSVGNQRVSVAVDNAPAGELNSGAAQNGTWLDQTLILDPSLTKGKSSISVAVNFISSDLDANEFMYALHCKTDSSWRSSDYGPSTDWALMDLLNVGPNNYHDEAIHKYQIRGQTWQGLRMYVYKDDRHNTLQSQQLLDGVTISYSFDGQDTVSKVPIGSFFSTSLGKVNVRSLLLSVDSLIPNGALSSWFPMPFTNRASVTIENNSPVDINPVVDWTTGGCPTNEAHGKFSVQYRRATTTPGAVWPILSALGPGIAYGLTHTFRASILPPANDLEFLEGDFQVYINTTSPPADNINSTLATILGTGTEDFYESGWYFADAEDGVFAAVAVPFAMPLTGLAGHIQGKSDLGCVGQCLGVYRLMVADSVPFGEDGISMNIEHGPVGNNIQADYETTAFYFA